MPVALLHKDKQLKKCDYCHRTSTVMYRSQVGENSPQYWLHAGLCLQTATKNYQQNLEKGLQNIFLAPQESEENEYESEMNL